MSSKFGELIISVSHDAISLIGLPASGLSESLRQYLNAKVEEARDELLSELRNGNVDALTAAQRDEGIGVIYRYFIAARDGAAKHNLRLLARGIVGLQKRDSLYLNEFSKYADVLSKLTRDQILVAAAAYVAYLSACSEIQATLQAQPTLPEDKKPRIEDVAWRHTRQECGKLQFSQWELVGLYMELMSHGLLNAMSAYGGLAHMATPKLVAIGELGILELEDTPAAVSV